MFDCSDAYFDRNQVVLALCAMLQKSGINVGWIDDREDADYIIMFVDLLSGQVSYHIPRNELNLQYWPQYKGNWDFHTTPQKRDRLYFFTCHILAETAHMNDTQPNPETKYEDWPVWRLWAAWIGSFVWPKSQEYLTIGAVIERKTAFNKRLRK
jgi:hypothetical protein